MPEKNSCYQRLEKSAGKNKRMSGRQLKPTHKGISTDSGNHFGAFFLQH
jgi:hypothetical protein